jgi:AbrB family looped-hinge helix DNA binding protein
MHRKFQGQRHDLSKIVLAGNLVNYLIGSRYFAIIDFLKSLGYANNCNTVIYICVQTSTYQQGGVLMPVVKISRGRQVTIPKKLFDEMRLAEGDYIEVERQGDILTFRPATVIAKDKAKAKLFALIDTIQERNKDVDPKEVEVLVSEAIREVRQAKRKVPAHV